MNRIAIQRLLFVLFGCFIAVPSFANSTAWQRFHDSSVRLISDCTHATPEQKIVFALEFRLSDGWHAYWKNPGVAGFPPQITWQKATGLKKPPELLYPIPGQYPTPGGILFGYQREVVYPMPAEVADAAQEVLISFKVDYLVCREQCSPHQAEFELMLPVLVNRPAEKDAVHASRIEQALLRVPVTMEQASVTLDRVSFEHDLIRFWLGPISLNSSSEVFIDRHPVLNLGMASLRLLGSRAEIAVPIEGQHLSNETFNTPLRFVITHAGKFAGLEGSIPFSSSYSLSPILLGGLLVIFFFGGIFLMGNPARVRRITLRLIRWKP